MLMRRRLRLIALWFGLELAALASARACDVPVFRFALERWSPDPYQLTVIPRRGATLSPDETAVLEILGKAGESEESPANLIVAKPAKGESKVESETATAQVALRYPRKIWGAPELPPFWSGELNRENAHAILESPLRRELAKRLLSGESAVWVLVETGKPEADRKTAEVLESAIKEAKAQLSISEDVMPPDAVARGAGFPVDPDNALRSPVPLKIDFSVLRLSRSDPNEQVLLAMLLHLEEDLAKYTTEPMIFPVFGRGRVLEPLIGAGIHRDNLLEYAAYLCGACSCQVKEQNPGMDLLIRAGWESAIDGSEVVIDKVLPPLEGVAALISKPAVAAVAVEAMKPATATAEPAAGPKGIRLPVVLAASLGAALLAIALTTVVLVLRMNRKQ